MNKYKIATAWCCLFLMLVTSACSTNNDAENLPDSSADLQELEDQAPDQTKVADQTADQPKDQTIDQNERDVSVDAKYDILACQKAIDPNNNGNQDCPSPITPGIYCCSIGVDNGCDGILYGGNSSQTDGRCVPALVQDASGVKELYVDEHGCYTVRFEDESCF